MVAVAIIRRRALNDESAQPGLGLMLATGPQVRPGRPREPRQRRRNFVGLGRQPILWLGLRARLRTLLRIEQTVATVPERREYRVTAVAAGSRRPRREDHLVIEFFDLQSALLKELSDRTITALLVELVLAIEEQRVRLVDPRQIHELRRHSGEILALNDFQGNAERPQGRRESSN